MALDNEVPSLNPNEHTNIKELSTSFNFFRAIFEIFPNGTDKKSLH